MTKEEAIEFGNKFLEVNENSSHSNTYAFFRMALKSLEQESILDKIKAEIETKYEQCAICEWESGYAMWEQIGDIDDILQIIDKYQKESEGNL